MEEQSKEMTEEVHAHAHAHRRAYLNKNNLLVKFDANSRGHTPPSGVKVGLCDWIADQMQIDEHISIEV